MLSTEVRDAVFPSVLAGTLVNMKRDKFEPTILRNRWKTNWAITYLSAGQPAPNRVRAYPVTTHRIAAVSMFSCALLVFGVWFWRHSEMDHGSPIADLPTLTTVGNDRGMSPSGGDHQPSPKASGGSTAADVCTSATLQTAFDVPLAQSDSIPKVTGFAIKALDNFGGTLIGDYTCESASRTFRVQWNKFGDGWRLRQISRLPQG